MTGKAEEADESEEEPKARIYNLPVLKPFLFLAFSAFPLLPPLP